MDSEQSKLFDVTLQHCLDEVNTAWLEKTVLSALDSSQPWQAYKDTGFIHLAYQALAYSMVSRIIKVLDRNKDAATFWNLYEDEKERIHAMFAKSVISNGQILFLEDFARRLKKVRDKIYFHTDKKAIFNKAEVWREADLSSVFTQNMFHLMRILTTLYKERFGKEYPKFDYTGNDAYEMAEKYLEIISPYGH